jgi:tRNA(adenine34) deaminase
VGNTEKDIHFMELALEEASLAFSEGEVPIGAVLVSEDVVISRTHNTRESSKDPTAHAELIAIRNGAEKGSSWRLGEAILYVTKEPCIMCAGAIVNARIGRLVYGCKDEKGGAVSLYKLLSDRRLNHQVEVISGVLEEECAEMLIKFFKERR